ncbi:MAG: alpha/beta hydrolase [Sphingomonas taxi]
MHAGARWSLGTLVGAGALTAAGALGLSFYAERIAREAERLVPQDGRHIQVDGARLHYVDRGSGPAIVMVHGLGGQLRNFSYAMLDLLSASHRVILVDRPGSGYSTADDGEPGIVAQGTILGRFIEALGVERPLLVGHSLGGAVALALALERPELIRGLALIAPLTQAQEEVPENFRPLALVPPALRQLLAHTVGPPLTRLTRERGLRMVFAPETPPEDFATRGGGALTQRPSALAAAHADLKAAGDEMAGLVARYPDLAVPIAILFGRDDAVLDPTLHGRHTADTVPGTSLELIEGGHMIPVTAPEASADFVARASVRFG